MADCKWMLDEICVNADCPMCCDYCPVADTEGVCRYEERGCGLTMADTREKLVELIGLTEYGEGSLVGNNFQRGFIEKIADHLIANGVTIDPASLRPKGEWELTVHSFYRDTFDESCELSVYIVANCSECFGRHPNSYQVFSKTLYAPEDADDGFRFDQKAEEDKALREFRNRNYQFAYFCPNCGCAMEGNK